MRFVLDGDETLDDALPFEAPEGDGCLGAVTHSISATPHELAGGEGDVDPALTDGLVAGADGEQSAHEALAELVWAAPADRCLRLERGAELDDATGVLFESGACEARGEDAGALWLDLDVLVPENIESLADWLADQPAMVVPSIPPPR